MNGMEDKENLEQVLDRVREKAFTYAAEAFEEHKEQMFEALQVILQCIETANKFDIDEWVSEEERERDPIAMDPDLFLTSDLECFLEEKDAPLKELLLSGIRILSYGGRWNWVAREIFYEAEEHGYSGYEWYVIYIYMTGLRNIYIRNYEAGSDERGSVKDSMRKVWLLSESFCLRAMVPEPWLEDYDEFCREQVEKQEQAKLEERVDQSFKHARFVKAAFERIFGKMEPDGIRHILTNLNYRTVAAGIAFAAEPVRNRFLENMTVRERKLVMRVWDDDGSYRYSLDTICRAMDRMMMIAGLTGGK